MNSQKKENIIINIRKISCEWEKFKFYVRWCKIYKIINERGDGSNYLYNEKNIKNYYYDYDY